MMRRRLLLIGLIALLVLTLGAGIAYQWLKPIEVEIARVEGEAPVQVFGLGTVEAEIVSRIGFEIAGTLSELRANQGDRVTAGALLARIGSREQEARVAQARAAVIEAEAAIRQSVANVERAQSALRQRAQVNERRQALFSRGNVSVEAADDAQTGLDLATADLAQVRAAADVARAHLEQARALAALEEARLSKYALYAPYDAVIVSRNRELGSMLPAGDQLFTLLDPASVWMLAYIDEARAGQLRIGQAAQITLRSLADRRFSGRIVRIDIESDRVNEERRVYVRCQDCPEDFHLGEQAEVTISIAQVNQARLVPEAAVIGLQGHHGVIWTVEEGHLSQRAVMFGQRTLDGRLEIVDGLPAGSEAVAQLNAGLRVGRQAIVRPGR